MAIEDILKKYKPESIQDTTQPEFKVRQIDALEGNPRKSFFEGLQHKQRMKAYNVGTANYEKSMQPDGVFKTIKDTAFAVPGAAAQIVTETIKDPVKSARGLATGALDFGPRAANTAQWLGRAVMGSIFGKESTKDTGYRLPMPSETLAEYLNYERSDVEKALSEGTTQYLGYAAGEAPLKAMGLGNTAVNIAGDIIGGQIVSESEDTKERLTQTAFDGLFGAAQLIGGKLFRKAKGKGKVEIDGGTVTEVKGGEVKPVEGQVKTEAKTGDVPEVPKTAYVAKADLGVDSRGKKIMATTEVDTKTGDAIVYYSKDLDANPQLRQIVWDFEEPHILDKRLTQTGDSFTPNLANPGGNISVIEAALGSFAKKLGQNVEEVGNQLYKDIQLIAKNNKVITEQFADAFGLYKNKPELVTKKAPTLAKFFEHQLVEPRYSKNITTEDSLAKEFPNLKKIQKEEQELIRARGTKSAASVGGVQTVGAKNLKSAEKTLQKAGEMPSEIKTKKVTKDFIKDYYETKKPAVKGDVFVNSKGERIEIIDVKDGEVKYSLKGKNKPIDGVVYLDKNKQLKPSEYAPKPDLTVKEKIATKKTEVIKEKIASKFSATKLDTNKRVKGRTSTNLDMIDAPADVEKLFNRMDAENKNFSSQRISKTNEDLKDLARMTGLTEDELLDLDPGSIANSETLVAARQIVLNKAADLSNKLKGIDTTKASLAQKAEVRDSFVQLLAMQKSVAGLRTEASNVFRSFGVKLRPGENIAIDELIANLKKMGIDDIDPNDMAALTEAAGKIAKDIELTFKEKLGKGALQTWYASILSGPKTTVRNVLSTSANILSEMTAKTFDPRQWKEIIPAFEGLVKGWKESAEVGSLKKIFSLEATDPSTGKFFETADALEGKQVFSGPFAKFGRLVEIPGRILNRQDVRFRAAAREMEKASLAVYNPKISEKIADAISDEYGTSLVYRGTPKGRVIEGLAEMSLTFLKKVPEGRLIMPFVNTVANVMDRQFDYIPLTSMLRLTDKNLMRQVERIAKDAGITETLEKQIILKRLRDQQLGRMSMGLAATAGVVAMAKNGMVSGSGPSNYSERVQLQRTGWRPNSIKIGDTWVPYTYLGPMAGIFALGGNIHDKIKYEKSDDKELSEIIGNGVIGWMRTQLNSSFLSGPADLIDVLTNRKRWKDYTDEFIASKVPIPQLLTQSIDIGKNITGTVLGDDSYKQQYETRGIVNKLRKNLGLTGDIGIADALNPRYDQFGTPMTSDLIFGVTPSEDKSDAMKVESFLINNDVVVSIPVYTAKYTTPTGETRKLTENEYSEYVRKSGKQIYQALSDALPALETMPEDAVKKQVKSIVSGIREQVRNELLY